MKRLLAAAAALAGLAFLVAVTHPALSKAPRVTVTPPPPAAVRPIAFADDTGSLVVHPGRTGFSVVGRQRFAPHGWRGKIGAGGNILGCAPCPAAFVLDRRGRAFRLDGSKVVPIAGLPSTPADDSTGIPGAGLDSNRPLWTTRPSTGVVDVYPLGGRSSGPLGLPLSSSVELRNAVAVDRAGAHAVALGPDPDPLMLGRRRLVEVTAGSRAAVARPIDVRLAQPEETANAAVCISPDGRRVAGLLPAGSRTALVAGAFGGPLRKRLLSLDPGNTKGCGFSDGRLVAFGVSSGLRVAWPHLSRTVPGFEPDGAVVCARGGIVAAAGPQGAAIVRPGGVSRYPGAQQAGCTPAGTPWILVKGRVRWLT